MKSYSIATFSAIILVMSTIKLMCFYTFFDINIFDFIEADEILVKAVVYLPFVLLFLALMLAVYKLGPQEQPVLQIVKGAERFENVYLLMIGAAAVFCMFATLRVAVGNDIEHGAFFRKLLGYLSIVLVFFVALSFFYIRFRSKRRRQERQALLFDRQIAMRFLLVQAVVIFSLLFSVTEITRARHNLLYQDTRLVFESDTVRCSADTTLIGFTKGYVFLFDNKREVPVIYNREKLVLVNGRYSLNGR
ncbi:MAG: hypothetical protein EOO11_08565 [Chitinophagaceae bacterium]|nr:MAG: hypothetical protein EOO11_08565 [Chitinophagaceae bacterium]